MNTLASITLRTGETVTGRLIEHRGHGIVVVERDGQRYAGELREHADRRLRALADVVEHTAGGIHV